MRYAILSDIHANKRAWDAFLADIAEQSIDSVICLGDVIGYGPMPQAVLDGVRETCAAVVLGNHDAAVCGRLDTAVFNDHARTVIEWTRGRLDEFDINFLQEVPLAVEGGEDILFVHAEAIEPGRFDYVTNENVAAANFESCLNRLIFCGHTHKPCVFSLSEKGVSKIEEGEIQLEADKRYLINVGSAGEPREADDLRGRYVIYDADQETLSYRAIEFDIDAYREDLLREGLEIKPFFLRAADFMNGVRTQPLVPESHAMSRSPVVPASKIHESPQGVGRSAYDPVAYMVSATRGIEVGKGKARPALIVSMILVAVLLAGAAYFVWPALTGGGGSRVVADSASEEITGILEGEAASGEAEKLVKTVSTNTSEATKMVSTTSAVESELAPAPAPASLPKLDGMPPVSKKHSASEAVTKAGKLGDGLFAVWTGNRDYKSVKGPYKVGPRSIGKPKRNRGKFSFAMSFSPGAGLAYGKASDHVVDNRGMSISFWYHPNNPQDQVKHLLGTASSEKISSSGGWSIYSGLESMGLIVGDGVETVRVESHLGNSGRVVPWRHVVAVIDLKAKRARLFKNGEHVGEADLSAFSSSIPAIHPLTMGIDPGGQGKFNYWGSLDDVAIWSRPLSAAEVTKIHKMGVKNKAISSLLGS